MYYKDFWIVKVKKNGGVIWEKTYGGPYMEKADDIVSLESGGYAIIGDKCDHNHDLTTCGPKAKILVMWIDDDGEFISEELFSNVKFLERMPYFSITTTANGGLAWTAEHKNHGTWIYKWGPNEDTVNVYSDGIGGFEINRTSDDGFIIGTWGGIIIKTDSELYYESEIDDG